MRIFLFVVNIFFESLRNENAFMLNIMAQRFCRQKKTDLACLQSSPPFYSY